MCCEYTGTGRYYVLTRHACEMWCVTGRCQGPWQQLESLNYSTSTWTHLAISSLSACQSCLEWLFHCGYENIQLLSTVVWYLLQHLLLF